MAQAVAVALDARQLALELHAVLRDLDPTAWRDEMVEALRLRLDELNERIAELVERCRRDSRCGALSERLTELTRLFEQHMPRGNLPATRIREEWVAFGDRLATRYAALVAGLRQHRLRLPETRRTNWKRCGVHVGAALLALTFVALTPAAAQIVAAGVFFVYAWSMEVARRRSKRLNDRLMAFYGAIAHPHEHHRVNSATWYGTALFALSLLQTPLAAGLGLTVLGFADPAAASVGRRWGRVRFPNGRSLEGSLTFVAVGGLAALAAALLVFGQPLAFAALLAGVACVAGALAELVSGRVDDNLLIPLIAALAVWGVVLLA